MPATAKKSPTAKKPSAPAPKLLTSEETFERGQQVMEGAEGMANFARMVDAASVFPQSILRMWVFLDNLIAKLTKIQNAISEKIKERIAAKGKFEVGKIAVNLKESSKRSPKWKEEALKLARELHDLKGEPFDGEKWATSIIETYEEKPQKELILTESL